MPDNVNIDNVVDFFTECKRYLHSWLCIRKGHYEPYDIQSVKKVFMTIVANGSKDPLNEFIDGVEMGKIAISCFPIGLSKDVENKLYKEHLNITEEFEKKYNI